jgi:hypothetical protein
MASGRNATQNGRPCLRPKPIERKKNRVRAVNQPITAKEQERIQTCITRRPAIRQRKLANPNRQSPGPDRLAATRRPLSKIRINGNTRNH